FFRPVVLVSVALVIVACASVLARYKNGVQRHPGTDLAWTLVFEDLFDAEALDGSRWTSCYWWDKGGCTNLGNQELQWYRRGNVVPGEGVLVLEAREEAVKTSQGSFAYTSGLISTGRTDAEGERED